ncbi:hypothetical protein B0J12DRAFT_594018 [Macrophomina phaseolina]|uniref:DUF427 domain-containing protein n=1 Tax=Macrophomina phaseolina TaxID=35725 RepID=A0ABQ8GNI7_9PEZI|nr:hypothetical protein B0J12DRAFT_594018 [Macrophomina phaseolina]
MADTSDLVQLAEKIAKGGPYKSLKTQRRVRGLLNGKYAFDTLTPHYVWEHPYYPQFYIPIQDFTPDATVVKTGPVDGANGIVWLGQLSVGDVSTLRVLLFGASPLKNLVRVDFNAIDQWFEEDVPIYHSPKDPYKRIDILPSSRSVRVAVDGVTLAEATSPLFLFETDHRTRYYLPPTSVKWEFLTKSNTETYCPYKGKANYFHLTVNGKEYRDVVWCYPHPTAESSQVAGYLCFYNEKVDVWVDGVMEKKAGL